MAEPTIDLRLTGRNAQRVMLTGQTRSGKTTVAVELANAAAAAVWVDVKRENDPGWPVVTADRFLDAAPAQRPHVLAAFLAQWPRIVVQLVDRPGVKDADQLDATAEAVFGLGNTLLVIDDAMGVLESAPTYYVNRVLTMGASRGCGFMGIAQRVHRIPLVFLTEAQHVVAFVAYGESDVARLVAEVGPDFAEVRDLEAHHYLWRDRTTKTTHRFKPLRRVA